MMEILQKIDNEKVVICNLGNFYVSVGRDAVLLNNLKNENINCYICSKGIGKYKKTDKYIIALSKLLEIEQQDIQDRLSKKKDIGEIENKQKEEVKRKRKIWFQNKNKKTN